MTFDRNITDSSVLKLTRNSPRSTFSNNFQNYVFALPHCVGRDRSKTQTQRINISEISTPPPRNERIPPVSERSNEKSTRNPLNRARSNAGLGEGGCAIAGRLLRILGIPVCDAEAGCWLRDPVSPNVSSPTHRSPFVYTRIRIHTLSVSLSILSSQYSSIYSTSVGTINILFYLRDEFSLISPPHPITSHFCAPFATFLPLSPPRRQYIPEERERAALPPWPPPPPPPPRRLESARVESSDGGGIRRRAASRRRRPFTLALPRRRYASRPSRHLCQLFHPTRGSCLVSSRRNEIAFHAFLPSVKDHALSQSNKLYVHVYIYIYLYCVYIYMYIYIDTHAHFYEVHSLELNFRMEESGR